MKRALWILMIICLCGAACGRAEELRFPAQITHIEAQAFLNAASVTRVTLPEGVQRIESQAFAGTGLRHVTLPTSLTYIAPDAFDGDVTFTVTANTYAAQWAGSRASELLPGEEASEELVYAVDEGDAQRRVIITGYTGSAETLFLPDTLDGVPVYAIGDEAFQDGAFTQVRLPAQLECIGQNAFRSCASLISVSVPDTVTDIGPDAFAACSSLERVTLPGALEDVPYTLFRQCVSLKEVTMSVALSDMVFRECEHVETIHYLPGSAGLLPEGVGSNRNRLEYQSRRTLTAIDFAEGVTVIGDSAFQDGQGVFALRSVHLPSTLKTIGDLAFNGLDHLEEINLPDGLETIGREAFRYCPSLARPEVPDSVTSDLSEVFDPPQE